MELNEIFQMIFGIFGGLGIFLLGMKYMSDGMQAVAGDRMRTMISKVTDNRLIACGTGAGITALIQSSSVTTVMVVGMVNAGLMNLKQAVGVILGADIGTTITAWIISLHISDYGLAILGFSALAFLFAKGEKVRFIAMLLVGLGMVFFGLEIMKDSLMPIRHSQEILDLFSKFEPNNFLGVIKCVLVGALVTAIVQSSSATVAITITLARTGAIGYDTAVALVLGENIGTTITAFLASLGSSKTARKAAFAHISIKVIGVFIMVPMFFIYLRFLTWLLTDVSDIATRIAVSHTVFNILIVLLFLPNVALIVKLINFLVPDAKKKEIPHLTYFDVGMCETPMLAIEQSFQAVLNMANGVQEMMTNIRSSFCVENGDYCHDNTIFQKEQELDVLQKEIAQFISKMLKATVNQNVADEARNQLRISDEYESISDYIEKILKLRCRLQKEGLKISEKGLQEICELHDMIFNYLKMIFDAVESNDENILNEAAVTGKNITRFFKTIRSTHLNRLEKNEVSPIKSLNYVDMLNAYRKIKDHAYNIAEVLAGEK